LAGDVRSEHFPLPVGPIKARYCPDDLSLVKAGRERPAGVDQSERTVTHMDYLRLFYRCLDILEEVP